MKLIYDGLSYFNSKGEIDMEDVGNPMRSYIFEATIEIEPEDAVEYITIGKYVISKNRLKGCGHGYDNPKLKMGVDLYGQPNGSHVAVEIKTRMGCYFQGQATVYKEVKDDAVTVIADVSPGNPNKCYTDSGLPAKMRGT